MTRFFCNTNSNPSIYLGCSTNYDERESGLLVMENVTTVPNPLCTPSCPPDCGGGYDCSGMYDLAIAPYPTPVIPYPVESRPPLGCGQGALYEQNCYTPKRDESGNLVYTSLASCHKQGFKNVIASKTWHGAFGFLEEEPCWQVLPDCLMYWESAGARPMGTTKYLGASWDITFNWAHHGGCGMEEPNPISISISQRFVFTVDPLSGKRRLAQCLSSQNAYVEPSGGFSWEPFYDMIEDIIEETWGKSCYRTIIADSNWNFDTSVLAGECHEVLTHRGTAVITSNTHFQRTYTFADAFYTINWQADINLFNPYTSAQVEQDVYGMLQLWDLRNDIQYPWRTDQLYQVAPHVRRNEIQDAISPLLASFSAFNTGCIDIGDSTDSSEVDGTIIGAPLETRVSRLSDTQPQGIGSTFLPPNVSNLYFEPYWDWNYFQPGFSYDYYGGYRPSYLPHTATSWTDADNLPNAYDVKGAYLSYRPRTNIEITPATELPPYRDGYSRLTAQAWAEVLLTTKPRQNWAYLTEERSGERDSYTQNCTGCVCGGSCYDDITHTLGERGYEWWSGCCTGCDGNGYLNPAGDLRWVGWDLYRLTPAEVDLIGNDDKEGTYLVREWHYDYRNYNENKRLIAQAAAADYNGCGDPYNIAPPPGNFQVTGPLIAVTTQQSCYELEPCKATAVYLYPFPANTTGTLPPHSYYRNSQFNIDDRYGSKWHLDVQQWMTDIFWREPAQTCSGVNAFDLWLEDDGSCKADGTPLSYMTYYPLRPYVEAVASIPAYVSLKYPNHKMRAISCDLFLTWLESNKDDIHSGIFQQRDHQHNICEACYPPEPTTYVSSYVLLPWVHDILMEGCVNGGGRFGNLYRNWVNTDLVILDP